jgi:hypothetical protein|tara:strand:+ start:496 stop:885 length:390 start_codon:yes stop_codon:yes gene_type:complete
MSVKGNKNAEKWTVKEARKLANKALDAVDDETFFISSIAEKCETYRDLFAYLMDKFNDDEVVFRTLKRMYNKCESILWERASQGEIDRTIAIFALKSLHGLMETSKQEIDHTTDGESINPINWVKDDSD